MPTPRLFLLQVGQELSPDNPKTFRVSTTGRHQDMVLYQGELWFTAKYFVEMYAWKVSGWSNAFMRDKWQTSEEWLAIRSGALVYPFFRRWFILPNAGGWLCSNTVYRIGGREVFVAASWNCFQFWSLFFESKKFSPNRLGFCSISVSNMFTLDLRCFHSPYLLITIIHSLSSYAPLPFFSQTIIWSP